MWDYNDGVRMAAQAEMLVNAGYMVREPGSRESHQSYRMTWRAWAVLIADAERRIGKPPKVTREQIERDLAAHRDGVVSCLKF